MAQAFLIIISALGAIYALFTKQGKTALGLLIVAVSFVFVIPDLVTGVWTDIFGAMTMILFALGIIMIVYHKKAVEAAKSDPGKETDQTK